MTQADHVFAAAIGLVMLSLLFRKTASAGVKSRGTFYLGFAATGLLLGTIVLLLWTSEGRALRDFGVFDWIGNRTVTAVGAVVWLLILTIAYGAVSKGCFRSALETAYGKYRQFMPRTPGELSAAFAVSVAAGVGEELVFRGYLLWYAATVAGLPAGIIGTSVLFGVAHGYQSRFGVIFATFAGLVLAGAYVASGSLVLVIWMHATYDIWSFAVGRLVLADTRWREDPMR